MKNTPVFRRLRHIFSLRLPQSSPQAQMTRPDITFSIAHGHNKLTRIPLPVILPVSMREHFHHTYSPDQPSPPVVVEAARQYLAQFANNEVLFFEAIETDEFHHAFQIALYSLPESEQHQLFMQAQEQNAQFQQAIDQGHTVLEALLSPSVQTTDILHHLIKPPSSD